MLLKKMTMSALVIIGSISSAYAGPKDWTGTFLVKSNNGKQYTVSHSPQSVEFLFVKTETCLNLPKNSLVNELKIPENIQLCTNQNVEDFSKELRKLGIILRSSVTMSAIYTQTDYVAKTGSLIASYLPSF